MAKVTAHWLASLSNGETAIEGKTPYNEIAGIESPYQRLRLYCSKNKLLITNIRLQIQVDDQPVRTFNLPSLSPKAKWLNRKPIMPIAFDYFRTVEQDMKAEPAEGGYMVKRNPEGDRRYIEAHAIYEDYKLVIIVDEDEGNESWSMILPNN